jgi:hypothetical protein
MKYVWAIEQGQYSDYNVCGVFSSKANADKVCARINREDGGSYDEANVVRWPLDPCIDEMNSGLKCYNIEMRYNGDTKRLREQCLPHTYEGMKAALTVWKRTKAPAYQGNAVSDHVTGTVWAKDGKHAIKITNEYRAQAIAQGRMKRREGRQ